MTACVEHVGVGVAGQAALVRDLDAAEDQPAARARTGACRCPMPGADAHAAERLHPPLPALEHADLASRRTASSSATACS